jgi:UDPglucose--hexose-1-phosphate uridylyltransferase
VDLSKLKDTPHRRFNPLIGEWVLVSPHRTQRPWQGQNEKSEAEALPAYDPTCYLCPGNVRAGGARNPNYSSTFVFENDYAALKPGVSAAEIDEQGKGLLVAKSESGLCKVVCFSPRHDLTLARMDTSSIRRVVDVWAEQYSDIGSSPDINYVEIFENRGAIMGCSNPHPHGQIWANQTIPNDPAKEQASLAGYQQDHGNCLLCEYISLERASGERVVVENEHFLVVVPFWATWPFETMLLSKRHTGDLAALTAAERDALAEIFKGITTRYDNLFEVSFPYSMGFHQRPTDGLPHPEWHLHAHFFPPLLRSATVRKFMVGYELLASPQRDITPETAAERLRAVSAAHFLERP